MIIDVTGIELIPGNGGKDCPGNGAHVDEKGKPLECCCDECSYMLCCVDENWRERCKTCFDEKCPHFLQFEYKKKVLEFMESRKYRP